MDMLAYTLLDYRPHAHAMQLGCGRGHLSAACLVDDRRRRQRDDAHPYPDPAARRQYVMRGIVLAAYQCCEPRVFIQISITGIVGVVVAAYQPDVRALGFPWLLIHTRFAFLCTPLLQCAIHRTEMGSGRVSGEASAGLTGFCVFFAGGRYDFTSAGRRRHPRSFSPRRTNAPA